MTGDTHEVWNVRFVHDPRLHVVLQVFCPISMTDGCAKGDFGCLIMSQRFMHFVSC